MTGKKAIRQAIPLLKALIEINSVNPSLVSGGAGEGRIARYLDEFFKRHGVESEVVEVAPGRHNVVARVAGHEKGPRVLLNGHLDTVGIAAMAAPFEAREEDGRIYGRGSQDMKGGLAAAVTGLLALAEDRNEFGGEVIFAGVADEEDRSIGTQHFLQKNLMTQPIDFCIVLEPTDLKVCTAHKGFSWLEVTTYGKAAHGSRPREGLDAIRHMGRVLDQLDHLDKKLQSTPIHPLLGSGSLHASMIEGGREWSTYPDHCLLKYERRTVPPESPETAQDELVTILSNLTAEDPGFHATIRNVCSRPPWQQEIRHPMLARFYQQAIEHFPGIADWGTVSFWTDAALVSETGIPCAVFGPRGGGLHSVEEYVVASDVGACAELLYDFVIALSGD